MGLYLGRCGKLCQSKGPPSAPGKESGGGPTIFRSSLKDHLCCSPGCVSARVAPIRVNLAVTSNWSRSPASAAASICKWTLSADQVGVLQLDLKSDGVLDSPEPDALATHERALRTAGGAPRVIPGTSNATGIAQTEVDPATANATATGQLDTAWSACTDHDRRPLPGAAPELLPLRQLPDHPGPSARLLGLLDALA